MKVKIELMMMGSESGYVPSSGYNEALLVDTQAVVDCMGDAQALWRLNGVPVTEDMLADCKTSQHQSGACIYDTASGIISVPNGKTAIQREELDISTNSGTRRHAWIVSEASLKTLYLERAARYQALANRLDQ